MVACDTEKLSEKLDSTGWEVDVSLFGRLLELFDVYSKLAVRVLGHDTGQPHGPRQLPHTVSPT